MGNDAKANHNVVSYVARHMWDTPAVWLFGSDTYWRVSSLVPWFFLSVDYWPAPATPDAEFADAVCLFLFTDSHLDALCPDFRKQALVSLCLLGWNDRSLSHLRSLCAGDSCTLRTSKWRPLDCTVDFCKMQACDIRCPCTRSRQYRA